MRATLDRARRSRGDDGFTLIELLIVIVILGVLAAIVVFSVKGITNKGDKAACQTEIATIDTAFEAASAEAPTALDPSTTAVSALSPAFLHTVPSATLDGQAFSGTMMVSAVDALTCP